MTNTSSTRLGDLVKSSRDWIGKWEVFADGKIHRVENMVDGIILAHQLGGELAQVTADPNTPHGFRRIPHALPPAEICEDLARRTPQPPASADRVDCVPIFGR